VQVALPIILLHSPNIGVLVVRTDSVPVKPMKELAGHAKTSGSVAQVLRWVGFRVLSK
jgi:hypothetical protein